jgi:CDP-4-dehydro-6-deoxyglucose reductase/ferredoxin-NAD(P)+ reductase (naphthalene dioxygenase ferredoxin-specific)
MPFIVKIKNRDDITVDEGNTILEAALDQGIEFPHGCRSGNCGACKSEKISGKIEMSPYSEFALEEKEEKAGFILACRAVPWSDCEIKIVEDELIDDLESNEIKNIEYEVKYLRKVSKDIYSINLHNSSNEEFKFKAGQYAELYFNNCKEKHFSMASSPNTNELEFHLKILDGGEISNYVENNLKIGDKIKIKGPYGNAYLRDNHKGPIIAVAGGTGLAPILSIIKSSQEKGMRQPIKIYYGAKSESDLYFTEKIETMVKENQNLKFIPVVINPSKNKIFRTGLVTDAVIEDIKDFDGYKAYLAGPPKMVEAAEKIFTSHGIRKVDMHSDAFYTPYDEVKEIK